MFGGMLTFSQKYNWFCNLKSKIILGALRYFCLEIFVHIHSPLLFITIFFGKYISKVCKVYSEEFSIGNGRFYTFVSAHKAICYGCSAQSLIIFKEVPYPHSGTLQHQANLKGFFYQLTTRKMDGPRVYSCYMGRSARAEWPTFLPS